MSLSEQYLGQRVLPFGVFAFFVGESISTKLFSSKSRNRNFGRSYFSSSLKISLYGAGQVVHPNWTFTRIGHLQYLFIYLTRKSGLPEKNMKIFIYSFNPSEPTANLNIYLFYFAFYPNFAIRPLPFFGKGMSTSNFAQNTTENAVILHFARLSGDSALCRRCNCKKRTDFM